MERGGYLSWDDSFVPDDEVIYRRVPDVPDFLVPDLLTGERRPTRTAFHWDDDGISVHRSSLLAKASLQPDCILRKSTQMVFGFKAEVPRSYSAEIVDDPQLDDPPAGVAHALIQCEPPRPPRPRRRIISEALAQASVRIV